MTEDKKFKVILSYTGNLGGKSVLVSLSQKPDNGSFIPASYMVEGESYAKVGFGSPHMHCGLCAPNKYTHTKAK